MLKIKIGDKAPEFCLPDKDENKICLKDYQGKWVVLYFYPKDNTKGCTIEAIDFTSSLPEFSKLGAVVIGASPDSPKSHQKFIDKHELQILLVSDSPEILEATEFVRFKTTVDEKTTAHVCINRFCKFPTNDISKMLELLNIV